MASFSWKDPKTGKTYYGAEGQQRWVASMAPAAPQKGVARPGLLPPPPPGTYDPSIDFNASASKTGLGDLTDDSQTAFEQGQQDYKRATEGIGTQTGRENENYGISTADLAHQFSILGHQQADHAAQAGITSAGLLGKSAAIRGANQAHDQSAIDLGHTRSLADLADSQKTLDINNARQFGGFNGQQIINPLTGKPETGSLVTGLTRAGRDDNSFQIGSAAQRSFGAAQGGFVPPTSSAPSAGLLAYMRKKPPVKGVLR